ncbi:MAG: alpha/beta fold hydrolase [Pseudomonadota bacterium]|nr:alpha/beta fold hydrolase [Pseudomonadota bacterium]
MASRSDQSKSAVVAWLTTAGAAFLLLFSAQGASARDYAVYESEGAELAYTDNGSGDTVIILHGFDGAFEPALTPLAERLSPSFRVIGIDQRGHGRSDKPHGEDAYGKHLATDVLKLMDHLGIPTAHLIGHSMGGIVALNLAANYPERFHSAVTIGNGLFTRAELKLIGWLIKGKFAWARVKAFVGINGESPRPEHDSVALLLLVGSLHELTVSEEQAAAIKVPLMGMRGGPDDDPSDTVEQLAQVNPAVEMIRIESEDHLSTLKCETCLTALEVFLIRHSAAVLLQPAR